jgi:hypothetical protein
VHIRRVIEKQLYLKFPGGRREPRRLTADTEAEFSRRVEALVEREGAVGFAVAWSVAHTR